MLSYTTESEVDDTCTTDQTPAADAAAGSAPDATAETTVAPVAQAADAPDAPEAPEAPTDDQDTPAGEAEPAKGEVLRLDEFLWLAVSSQAQLQALADMPLTDLNDDELGRERFTKMHRKHRREARKVVPSSMYEQLRAATPSLPTGRVPTAVELRSAYAGFDSWCQHVYSWAKQQMAAKQQAGAAQPAAAAVAETPRPGQYL